MKHDDVTPLHKKYETDNKSLKENHRPASILPILLKTLDRNMFRQMSSFFDGFFFFSSSFSKYQYGLRKASSTQQSLLDLLEKWKRSIDRSLGYPKNQYMVPFFNIFLADLFFTVNSMDIGNYVNEYTPHAAANDIDTLIASLEEGSKSFFIWFEKMINAIF